MKVLLTGPTGLLGSVLLASLLRRGHQVFALGRGREELPARERVRRVLLAQGMEPSASRPRVLETGGTNPLAALIASAGPIDAVAHTAAAVKFSLSPAELRRENIDATAELLHALDLAAPRAHFHYLSTAFICGGRPGPCRESERDLGQAFRQPYEETKLLAEGLVEGMCLTAGRPFTIHRPSIIAGSSRTGAAANFNGLGHFLRTIDVLARGFAPRTGRRARTLIRCDPRAGKNVVPVDWVAEAIARLMEIARPGRTYHLTHPRPLLHAEIIAFAQEEMGLRGLEALEVREGSAPTSASQRLIDQGLRSIEPYLWGEPAFDRTHLEEDLGPAAAPPPVDRDYLRKILAFGRSSGWASHPLEEPARAGPGDPLGRSLETLSA